MPRGRPKKIITPQDEQTVPFCELPGFDAEKANSGVCRRLDEIEVRLLKLETAKLKEIKEEEEKKVEVLKPAEPIHPIPSDYLDLLTTILNSKFTAKIEYLGDRPEFMFTIVVPDEYTNIHPDFRSRVISNAEGLVGVRDWVNKVYSSFDPETKAKIKSGI